MRAAPAICEHRYTSTLSSVLPHSSLALRVAYVATNFLCACTLIRIPSPMNSEISAVPP